MAAPGLNTVSWSNIGATPAQFTLGGGRYQLAAVGTGWGTATLQIVGPDGSTLLTVTGAALSANGYVIFEIGEGALCQLTLATVSAFYGSISRIPLAPGV